MRIMWGYNLSGPVQNIVIRLRRINISVIHILSELGDNIFNRKYKSISIASLGGWL